VVQLVPQSQAGDCIAYVVQFTFTTASSTQQGHEYFGSGTDYICGFDLYGCHAVVSYL